MVANPDDDQWAEQHDFCNRLIDRMSKAITEKEQQIAILTKERDQLLDDIEWLTHGC